MISISILDCDLLNMEKTLKTMKNDGISHIHLDILDTSFVPNISFGPSFINRILQYDFIFDVHLMVETPLTIIKLLDLKRIDTVIIHYEIKNKKEVIEYLKLKNKKVGLAINPDTDIINIDNTDIINIDNTDIINRILIMTVYPGFGNQKFIEKCAEKIKLVKGNIEVAVDGGINLETVNKVKDYDFIIIGSAYFKAEDRKEFIRQIYEKIKSE